MSMLRWSGLRQGGVRPAGDERRWTMAGCRWSGVRRVFACCVSAVAFALVASLLGPFPVTAQGMGVLEGQVLNGTAGAAQPGSGLPVTLRAWDGEGELELRQVVTDASGRFRFDGLEVDPTLSYEAEVIYLGVPYWSAEPVQFAGEPALLSTVITVYETTEDAATVGLTSVHIIAESFGQVLRVSEVLLFGNSGDRTYVGQEQDGRRVTLSIPLPAGAVGFALAEGEATDRFVETEGGLLDTEPVRPDDGSVVRFSYHLMVAGQKVPLERRFGYPVGVVNVLLPQPGLMLQSSHLAAQEPLTFEGRQYQVYSALGLAADAALRMDLLPQEAAEAAGAMPAAATSAAAAGATGVSVGQQRILGRLGLALTILAAAGVLAYAGVRGAGRKP